MATTTTNHMESYLNPLESHPNPIESHLTHVESHLNPVENHLNLAEGAKFEVTPTHTLYIGWLKASGGMPCC